MVKKKSSGCACQSSLALSPRPFGGLARDQAVGGPVLPRPLEARACPGGCSPGPLTLFPSRSETVRRSSGGPVWVLVPFHRSSPELSPHPHDHLDRVEVPTPPEVVRRLPFHPSTGVRQPSTAVKDRPPYLLAWTLYLSTAVLKTVRLLCPLRLLLMMLALLVLACCCFCRIL
jgi:hypothetical protein